MSSPKTTKLPGFGLPVNSMHPSVRDRFPNAILDWSANNITVRERMMLRMIDKITDKPEWRKKVFDEELVGKWRAEVPEGFSGKMFDYCVAELRAKAPQHLENGMVLVYDTNAAIAKSDTIITSELQESLKTAVKPLENVPEHRNDWHPGSDGKVLDLVHPSLFPLVYGRSRILENGKVGLEDCAKWSGKGVLVPTPAENELSLQGETNIGWGNTKTGFWSKDFQWLPCDVHFAEDDAVEISSYINNLHPHKHEDLYKVVEQFIAASIPLWDEVLSHAVWRPDANIRITIDDDEREAEVRWTYPRGRHPPKQRAASEAEVESSQSSDESEESEPDYDRLRQWEEDTRVIVQPEPDEFTGLPESRKADMVDLTKQFKKEGIQVIVKLANIHLTPEKPEYEGGSWHVEGMLNEHICATSLYYYDSENITDSFLGFRQRTDAEELVMMPGQDEYDWVCQLYDVQQDGAAMQEIGKVLTREGRLLAFPNVLQHQISPFKLVDPTKPGHRKILALFLIDPHIPVISTGNVPPQQRDWWAEEARKDVKLAELPAEMFDEVIGNVCGFPMSMEDAKEIREKLMEERKAFVDECDQDLQQETFFFCEH